ncbi:MAG: glutamine synthetase adenylyltransferase, partial [Anaerolineae bacterium]|nr:glutamine synthetase adenylyltransferase [Anaerolineae bacterium]
MRGHLSAALADAADPLRVLASFERFLDRQENCAATMRLLAANPRTVEILVVLFAGSQFLSEILLRNPASLAQLIQYRRLSKPKSVEQVYVEAQSALNGVVGLLEAADALRRYQSGELLRIGACDLLDLYDLPAVTRQLSNLADGMIRICLKLSADKLGAAPELLCVLGMGKLGGRELNYSSDIDLLFITRGDLEEAIQVGTKLIDLLSRASAEGFLYRVDMRLRPWGSVGPLVSTLQGFQNYLSKDARPWEKQALLKARVVAGDSAAGRELLIAAQPFIFGMAIDHLRQEVREMKQRTEAQLRQHGRVWGEVKLGEGSIRDVEFSVQFLQLAYGRSRPELLTANTLEALVRLAAAEFITPEDYRTLAEGYVFLRTVEHHLQMMHYRQTHTLPSDADALATLARRLRFSGDQPGLRFVERYEQHGAAIRAVYLRTLGGVAVNPNPIDQPEEQGAQPDPLLVHRHIDRMNPSYSELYSAEEIARHASLADRLNDANPVEVTAQQISDYWRVTVVSYDYPGELSVITGLMFVFGFNILRGEAFTYEPGSASSGRDARRKIVDVFDVQPQPGQAVTEELWARYAADLENYQHMARAGRRRELQGDLTRRVANALQGGEHSAPSSVPALYPIEITIDNDASDQHTVLRIEAQDTFGFLYELTNALAISGVYIERVMIDTVGSRVQDVLFVTDANGRKITGAERQRELRTATMLIKQFTHLLPFSPNPESALIHFRDFIDQLFRRPNWPDELTSVQRPDVLEGLARLLGVSDFLWDDFLRMQYANLFPVVTDLDALSSAKDRIMLQAELARELGSVHMQPQEFSPDSPWIERVNAWRDREMFRIDMRHILGHTSEFWDFAHELTSLAEVVCNAVYHLCHEDLRLTYGSPLDEAGKPIQMSVVALGKFGGRELGFASDIELMFVYDGPGWTNGQRSITAGEFYEKLVESFVTAMRARREGIFEVDLQLRPYGKAGSLSVPLEAFKKYFHPSGPAWAYERQALVKLRPVAGDEALGREIEDLRDQFVYTPDGFDATAMRAMRERQLRHLVR